MRNGMRKGEKKLLLAEIGQLERLGKQLDQLNRKLKRRRSVSVIPAAKGFSLLLIDRSAAGSYVECPIIAWRIESDDGAGDFLEIRRPVTAADLTDGNVPLSGPQAIKYPGGAIVDRFHSNRVFPNTEAWFADELEGWDEEAA